MQATKTRRSGESRKALYLTTYDRLEQYLQAFALGHFHLLILVGSGGLAKSRTVRESLRGNGCWIEGNATAFGMYVKLYQHRDEFVVIDDVDALYADRSGVRLLKCLCQTEEEKSVAWHSDARGLERQGIPREFTTKSRVVIISNDWKNLNKNVAALEDRGHVVFFKPSAAEVHRKAGTWFGDSEIYEWFAANLHRIHEPSLRHYVRARELKAAGMDWTDVLAVEDHNPRARHRRRDIDEPGLCELGRTGRGVRRAGRRMQGDLLQLSAEAGRRGGVSLISGHTRGQMFRHCRNNRLTVRGLFVLETVLQNSLAHAPVCEAGSQDFAG